MRTVLGYLRLAIVAALFIGTFFLVALASITKIERKNVGIATWVVMPAVWAALRVFGVKATCRDIGLLRKFQGIILINHQSYLDIFLPFAFIPVRFMAAIEVRHRPILGWMSEALGCVFIDRGNMKSGSAVKQQVAQSLAEKPDPPLVIYPEGRLGNAHSLHKFRRGTFRIVAENEIPYLLCAIKYSHPEITTWHGGAGESMIGAIRRLAMYGKPIDAELIPLEVVSPKKEDKPYQLALDAREIVAQGLDITLDD